MSFLKESSGFYLILLIVAILTIYFAITTLKKCVHMFGEARVGSFCKQTIFCVLILLEHICTQNQ